MHLLVPREDDWYCRTDIVWEMSYIQRVVFLCYSINSKLLNKYRGEWLFFLMIFARAILRAKLRW
jgi:hypothetical protein